ncbi:MAG TPA: signal peptidase II [Streptosporangiaceae bacterium]
MSEVGRRDGADAESEPAGRRRVGVLLAVAVAVLVTDVITKVVVVATLRNGREVRLLGGLLRLVVTRNPGAAFSLGGPSVTVLFAMIAVGVVVFILRTSRRIHSLAWAITLGLLLGGATGNLTDRLARAPGPFRGWVVDWIQLPHWPVFNIADSSIVCGGLLAVLLAMRNVRIDGTRQAAGTSDAAGSDAGSGEPDRSEPGAERPKGDPGRDEPRGGQPGGDDSRGGGGA